jgi:hypothetical protein
MQPYLEGRLPTLERNEFVYHVTECAACEREVIAYRDVFRGLREMGRFDAPDRVGISVMAHLRAEGLIHEPRFPVAHRALDAFLAVPASLRYPVSALVVIVLLYAPVALILSGGRDWIAGVTEGFARGVLWVQQATASMVTVGAVELYVRIVRTVVHAAAAVVSPAMLLAAAIVAGMIIYLTTRVGRRKRPSGHAMFITF